MELLSVTFEEGTWAAWLYDLLKPHVAQVLACNPRKNAALNQGNRSDKIDARELANRLRLNDLHPSLRLSGAACNRQDCIDASRVRLASIQSATSLADISNWSGDSGPRSDSHLDSDMATVSGGTVLATLRWF